MPRLPTTSDAFNAIAEPRRRQLLNLLARGGGGTPRPVNDLARSLRLPQPTISKHLAVLRAVHLVRVHQSGRQRLYSLNPAPLRPIHTWINSFEHFWTTHLDAIKLAAERQARQRSSPRPQAPSPAAPKPPGPSRKHPHKEP